MHAFAPAFFLFSPFGDINKNTASKCPAAFLHLCPLAHAPLFFFGKKRHSRTHRFSHNRESFGNARRDITSSEELKQNHGSICIGACHHRRNQLGQHRYFWFRHRRLAVRRADDRAVAHRLHPGRLSRNLVHFAVLPRHRAGRVQTITLRTKGTFKP